MSRGVSRRRNLLSLQKSERLSLDNLSQRHCYAMSERAFDICSTKLTIALRTVEFLTPRKARTRRAPSSGVGPGDSVLLGDVMSARVHTRVSFFAISFPVLRPNLPRISETERTETLCYGAQADAQSLSMQKLIDLGSPHCVCLSLALPSLSWFGGRSSRCSADLLAEFPYC